MDKIKIKTYKIIDIREKEEELFEGTHELLKGKECVIAACEVGKPAWMFVHFPEEEFTNAEWHRVHTSDVQKIYIDNSVILTLPKIPVETIRIETMNTTYVLEREG